MYKIPKERKSAWVSRRNRSVDKPWGFEVEWSGFSGIHGKSLFIKEGHRTSLKFFKNKTEVLMLRSGSVEVTYGQELFTPFTDDYPMKSDLLSPGDSLLVQSGCPYRVRALVDSEIIEIGNYSIEKATILRDDYGRKID